RIVGPVLALFVQELLPGSTRVASMAGLIVGGQAATGAVGAIVLGRAGDRLGHRRVLVFCAFLAALLYVPQYFAQSVTQLLVWQLMVGLALGGLLTSVSALLAQHSPKGREGSVYGLDSSAVSAANFVAPMIGGSVAAAMGVRMAFLWTAGVLGLSAALVVVLLARLSRRGTEV
ncbi:MAG: multidrug efflux MFS transporter, partial [Chloroflexi bacterium]|nr:multidrug efflux MFS transporter [Chloroflexota bacterium]